MLEPRVSDLPAVFLLLVVLPMVAYFLLGKWYESSQKKNRISVLAQLAFEEVIRGEAVPSIDVSPTPPFDANPTVSSSAGVYECARCFAPATTRCSGCKSIRYCSGQCQIKHWRQVHKDECQLWRQDNTRSYILSGLSSVGGSCSPESWINRHPKSTVHGSESSSECATNSDTSAAPYSSYPVDPSNPINETYEVPELGKNSSSAWSTLPTEVSSMVSSPRCEMIDGNSSASNDLSRSSESIPSIFPSGANFPPSTLHQSQKSVDDSVRKPKNMHLVPNMCTNVEKARSDSETCGGISSQKFDLHKGVRTFPDECFRSLSSKRSTIKEGINYKKSPYTLGNADPSSDKSVKKTEKEHFTPEASKIACIRNSSKSSIGKIGTIQNESTDRVARNPSTGFESKDSIGFKALRGSNSRNSRQPSKDPKRSLLGLLNRYKRNKGLFPYEDLVKLYQGEGCYISPRGLLNCGNSCYANAVLQCLMCTKPLMVYLLQRMHSKTCSARDRCLMCELEQHVSMLRDGGGPLSPVKILSNMRNGGWRMCKGNQEDAHEFLRFLVMSLQSICLEGLGGEKNVELRLQETTLIHQIFGGRLRSKVKCMRCHHESEIYENIMDLTLEIHGSVGSLEDALRQFTSVEDLNGENMYKCGRCSAYVNARKQLRLHEVPNILTVVLKRFQKGKYGKINKYVIFPEMLDMSPFVTATSDSPPYYLLYAVVVHLDSQNASYSGHYVSYIKDLQGTWFRINDAEVQTVSMSQVMSEGAYMLFYSRPFPHPPGVYLEKATLQTVPPTSLHNQSSKTPRRSSKHGEGAQQRIHLVSNGDSAMATWDADRHAGRVPRGAVFSRSFSADFSDAVSSDWSLFTSSDESSFTTESTRDSFSVTDHSDVAGADPNSSLFGHYYCPELPYNSGGVSCSRATACRPETRFFLDKRAQVLEYPGDVHPGRMPEHLPLSAKVPRTLQSSNPGLHGGR